MLEEGLFERFPCDRVFGLHSAPGMAVGRFGTRTGPMMAASGRWSVTFHGSGGHGGAGPHLTQDLTVAAAGFVTALQAVVARNVSALEAAVISVGHVQAGSPEALNVMPSELVLGGTVRAFSEGTQTLLEARIRELAELHAAAQGATCSTKVWWNTVPTVTDAEATAAALSAAAQLGGMERVKADVAMTMGGEDFSYMLRQRAGSFMWLGNGSLDRGPDDRPEDRHDGDGSGQLHTPRYDFNDAALPWGVAYWLSVVNVELDGRLGS
jgi:hippurate hydrolase